MKFTNRMESKHLLYFSKEYIKVFFFKIIKNCKNLAVYPFSLINIAHYLRPKRNNRINQISYSNYKIRVADLF